MERSKIIKLLAVLVLLVLVGSVSFLLGDKHAVETMTIRTVTPDQVANAMKDDDFYANYRENTLLISGTVASVSKQHNDLVIGFKTSSSYRALCDFGSSSTTVHVGDTLTALTEGGVAERQPAAVLLAHCQLP